MPPPITLIEWMKFKDFYESCSLSCWEQNSKKFHHGGGDTPASPFILLCVMMLCFSFIVVLYSMYSLYAIIKVVLLNKKGVACVRTT